MKCCSQAMGVLMNIEVALDAHAVIGESPLWSPKENALYWIDVKAPALNRYEPATGMNRRWSVNSELGAFALTPDGCAIVALREGIHRLDLSTGALELLAEAPFDKRLFRFNEGACDASGRFWVGVMFDPLYGGVPARPGSLYSFTLEGGLRPEPDAAELHNGMAWSADGQRFYLSHSNEGEIYVFDFASAQGIFTNRRLFAKVSKAEGLPDGAAVDAKGGYWCAIHGGGRLRRFEADGTVDRDVVLPVSQPTMCAFAGDALDVLYVTSASDQLNKRQLLSEPLAGALLRLKPGVVGVTRPILFGATPFQPQTD